MGRPGKGQPQRVAPTKGVWLRPRRGRPPCLPGSFDGVLALDAGECEMGRSGKGQPPRVAPTKGVWLRPRRGRPPCLPESFGGVLALDAGGREMGRSGKGQPQRVAPTKGVWLRPRRGRPACLPGSFDGVLALDAGECEMGRSGKGQPQRVAPTKGVWLRPRRGRPPCLPDSFGRPWRRRRLPVMPVFPSEACKNRFAWLSVFGTSTAQCKDVATQKCVLSDCWLGAALRTAVPGQLRRPIVGVFTEVQVYHGESASDQEWAGH